MADMERLVDAISRLRAPLQQGEYDLHRLVMDALDAAALPYVHEARLAPRCRIDLLCGSIGIEIKRGKVDRGRILVQLGKYAACEQLTGLILVTERTLPVPAAIAGKPVRLICLNRLWGIAL
ncbi:MAG: hypothetical protein PUC00_08385 [Clostridiales bacterium]|nr:hypothetical protein [Clostridiales bacterium]